jgi:hypothetical protein
MVTCPQCDHSFLFDEYEAEVGPVFVTPGDRVLLATCDLTLLCPECDAPLKSETVSFSGRFYGSPCTQDMHSWDTDLQVEPVVAKGGGGLKTQYGVRVTGAVECVYCGAGASFNTQELVESSVDDP